MNRCYIDEIYGWWTVILERKKVDAKKELLQLQMMSKAYHSDPEEFSKRIDESIASMDSKLGKMLSKAPVQEGYYPDEDADLEKLDRLRAFREYHNKQ